MVMARLQRLSKLIGSTQPRLTVLWAIKTQSTSMMRTILPTVSLRCLQSSWQHRLKLKLGAALRRAIVIQKYRRTARLVTEMCSRLPLRRRWEILRSNLSTFLCRQEQSEWTLTPDVVNQAQQMVPLCSSQTSTIITRVLRQARITSQQHTRILASTQSIRRDLLLASGSITNLLGNLEISRSKSLQVELT